ncbi:KpsF/GutQ family sugar-phosphate isomerase [Marinovum sp. 2_MG-2023]|uniref:KpsF/GutQ family sugar-phosphate isomerase n=1 Tax=unclassified Marinovum TaxID=2647166 RepID=UPI0026E29143|nr:MULTISPECIES: KpsF/GutQ family sugar-phosphate isomerase [unclassified Marinovum]MDO6732116.1 KpsF/GutQ family sugar-phosphate isomerase [Marinovum sp. 2_MG-2023]MDO6781431.1 KpsF/GutQ family sugar-phosphate isomerase [Marinovum sp. 1_MG-2023]
MAYLADHLPADFEAVVDKVLSCTGRVIVSGIGKSGHIGRKLAATLASTGTPAYFVHATEASHGDLGMIGPGDVCLLISNSGETSELRDIVYHTQRFSIPMIGMSSKPDSTLMKAADYRLTLPDRPEACLIGMAPTTSTTLTLALGDALAVALMEQRGFVAEDFGIYHPGGKLGAQMRSVADLMHGDGAIPKLDQNAPMTDVLLAMTSKGFGVGVLMQGDVMSGIITDGDLRRNMDGLMSRKAIDVASTDPLVLPPDCLAPEALAVMNARKVNVVIVAGADRKPLGVLHIHDLLRAGVV